MKDTQKQYLDIKGNNCPKCQSDMIVGTAIETGGGHAKQEISCLKCDAYWDDHYTLTGFEIIENDSNNNG